MEISPDTKGFSSELDKDVTKAVGKGIKVPVTADTKGLGSSLDDGLTGAGQKGASKFAGGFKSGLGGAAAAIGGAAFVTQAFGFLSDSFADAIDAKKIAAQVTSVIANLAPDVRGAIGKAFEGVAGDISRTIAVDDDDVKKALLPILQIPNLTGPALKELATIASDVAAGTGKDLETVSKGVALIGQDADAATRLFKASGIVLSDSLEQQVKDLKAQGKAGEASQLVLDELSKRFAGAGKAAGDAAGPGQRFTVAMGELRESVGNALIPIIEKVTPIILKLTEFFSNLPGPVQKIIIVVGGIVAVMLVLAPIITAVTVALPLLAGALALLTSPITLIIAAVVLLGVIIVKNWDTIRNAIGTAVSAVVGFFGRLISTVVNFVKEWGILLLGPIGFIIKFRDEIGDAIEKVVGFIVALPGRLVGAIAAIGRAGLDMGKAFIGGLVDGFKGAVGFVADIGRAIKDFINDNVIERFNRAVEIQIGLPFGKKFDINPPDIPRLATGGLARGLALVGEAGPELVNFGRTSRVIPNGPTTAALTPERSVSLTMNNYSTTDPEAIAALALSRLNFELARR